MRRSIFNFVLAVVVVVWPSFVILRPDAQRTKLRAAEQLWQSGRITEAQRAYTLLQPDGDTAALVNVRLAGLALLRGECAAAQVYAAIALRAPTRRDEAAQAHLIAGACAAKRGATTYAEAEWQAIDPRSPMRPFADLLRGEIALQGGREQAAVEHYSKALQQSLPEPWSALTRLRLAALVAPAAPKTALLYLAAVPTKLPEPAPELRPFASIDPDAIVTQSQQLRAILTSSEASHMQLLGQYMLNQHLYRLALVRFEQVPPSAPEFPVANAYAAYSRWNLGQTNAALAQLRELAAAFPDQPVVATLFAAVALEAGELDAADAALDAAEARYPLDPAIALTRSDILAARRDYPRALAERRRARDIALADVKARYALAVAEQHRSLTHDLCGEGLVAARQAVGLASTDATAWQLLANIAYHCRAYEEAVRAARDGLRYAPNEAALHFWLGAALLEHGQPELGQKHLLAAADLAPASEWRIRAEQLLGWQQHPNP